MRESYLSSSSIVMKFHEIEYWALRVIDTVKTGHRVEDSRVELKSEWPNDIDKAARRIAGHANASRGASILWLLGVDEEKGVMGVEPKETSDWYSQITSRFDGLSPSLTYIHMPIDGKTVVALLFDTRRLPFVVKNPAFGSEKGEAVSFEVPWREGTKIRSAKRDELIRLLSPLQSLPEFEIMEANLIYREQRGNHDLSLSATLYSVIDGERPVVIPFYRCSASVIAPGASEILFSSFELQPPYYFGFGGEPARNLSKTIEKTQDEIIMYGPGKLFVRASLEQEFSEFLFNEDLQVNISLAPVLFEHSISLAMFLSPSSTKEGDVKAAWKLKIAPDIL